MKKHKNQIPEINLTEKTKVQILEIITTESDDLVSKAIIIARNNHYLNDAIVSGTASNLIEVRKLAVTFLNELPKNTRTKTVLKILMANKNIEVSDAAWKQWNAFNFHHKIKDKTAATV